MLGAMAYLVFLAPLALIVALGAYQLPRARTRRVVAEEVRRHRAVLRGKWLRAHDAYGTLDRDAWAKETRYFADRVVGPRVPAYDRWSDAKRERLAKRVSHRAQRVIARTDEALEVELADDPIAFEHRCADILRRAGWDARVVGGSGDQGADVVAERDGKQMIVQCKRYSRPIGNKAVQEAAAARAYYRAHLAAVVGTAPFTDSAHDLAKATDVILTDEAGLIEIGR